MKKNLSIIALSCILNLNTPLAYSSQEDINHEDEFLENGKKFLILVSKQQENASKFFIVGPIALSLNLFGCFWLSPYLVVGSLYPHINKPTANGSSVLDKFNYTNPVTMTSFGLSLCYMGYQAYKIFSLDKKITIQWNELIHSWKEAGQKPAEINLKEKKIYYCN